MKSIYNVDLLSLEGGNCQQLAGIAAMGLGVAYAGLFIGLNGPVAFAGLAAFVGGSIAYSIGGC